MTTLYSDAEKTPIATYEMVRKIDLGIVEARVRRNLSMTSLGYWREEGRIAALQDLRLDLVGERLA